MSSEFLIDSIYQRVKALPVSKIQILESNTSSTTQHNDRGQSMVASSVVPVARLDCLLSDIVAVMSGTAGHKSSRDISGGL